MLTCTDDFLVLNEVLILDLSFLLYHWYKLVTIVERSFNVDCSGGCHSNEMQPSGTQRSLHNIKDLYEEFQFSIWGRGLWGDQIWSYPKIVSSISSWHSSVGRAFAYDRPDDSTGVIQFVVLNTLPILSSWIKKVSGTTIKNLRWKLGGEIIWVTFRKFLTSLVQKLQNKLEKTEL